MKDRLIEEEEWSKMIQNIQVAKNI